MHLSVGTSAIIVPTAMMSVYHYKHQAVDLNILKTYGIFVVFGVIIGAFSAALMDTKSCTFFSLIIYLRL